MKFLSNSYVERRSKELLDRWTEAEGVPGFVFPIDVTRLSTDFLGIEVKFGSLATGTIAEFRVSDEVFILDRVQNKNSRRARFSIAHEIGHLMLHSALGRGIFCRDSDSNRKELQANRFAAALLMPAVDLIECVAEQATGLGRFARRAADADLVAASTWLRSMLRQAPLKSSSSAAVTRKFDVSLQSLTVRLLQLHVIMG